MAFFDRLFYSIDRDRRAAIPSTHVEVYIPKGIDDMLLRFKSMIGLASAALHEIFGALRHQMTDREYRV
ncbi:hypothetical protein N9L47_06930 [Rhodobacteraceae bacterium]|nr:hypothetical protein [Paracoccaceae bacterium]